jgi:hypothetical protein
MLLRLVHRLHRFEHLQPPAVLDRRPHQSLDVLWEAAAAVADSGVEEAVADAGIRADALSHLLDVDADLVRQVRELVHEADPVASIALAAYLVNSAALMSMCRTRSRCG